MSIMPQVTLLMTLVTLLMTLMTLLMTLMTLLMTLLLTRARWTRPPCCTTRRCTAWRAW